jgi:hypothetical protein
MTSEGKKIKNITGNNKNDNKISTVYPSPYYPGSDEIQVREFAKLHQEIPVVKGSFRKCKSNGILTNYDLKIMSQINTSCFLCTASSASLGLTFTICLKQIDMLPFRKNSKNFLIFSIAGAVVGGLFSCYKYFREINQLDRKYTAIWLKSIGKI